MLQQTPRYSCLKKQMKVALNVSEDRNQIRHANRLRQMHRLTHLISHFVRSTMPFVVLSALFCISPVSAKSDTLDPLRLQQQAVKRIERFIEHFKRTGDRTSL